MAEYYIARHFDELTKVFELLKNTWDWSKPLKIEWKASRKIRSLPQNSLFHVWCGEFATYLTQLSYMAPHPEFGPQMFQLEDVKTMAKREW
ncbi:MAG: hypothetical protein R3361_08510, partial [Aequorivita vladivostokensis]|nr:hypothetical protein [Aequorivita vladivostokensis]